jgi:hypothetical protein
MKRQVLRCVGVFVMGLVVLGCGDNLASPTQQSELGPPANLKAFSVDASTVRLQWGPAPGASDSLFAGYRVQWGGVVDSVGKAVLLFDADSLLPGEILFTVISRKVNGELSNGATIRWAPAARFDVPFALYEYRVQDPNRNSGIEIGTQSMDPSALPLPAGSTAVPGMDIYLYGGQGQLADPLELRSASLYTGDWNATAFSTVTDHAASLDFPLAAFPALSTFTEDHMAVSDSTIYYVRVQGDNQEFNFARLHIRVRPGTAFPDRAVEIRVSLQKAPGVPYAYRTKFHTSGEEKA